ncbi:hypothetical protein [Sphingomonas sp. 37zxx]|uniref:hypothetical protein n=1 Tax=Sphingomonas sp. 37zxx TaxID=1550073 RepID=UPI000A599594|nr:hypothetical protein [Sphingomonas sp. 37zxx]
MAVIVAGFALAPAIGAPGEQEVRQLRKAPSFARSGIGSFTPASADPRLAAALARTGLSATGFRFTPSEAHAKRKEVTVAVRARTIRDDGGMARGIAVPTRTSVSLQPIAYNLGMSVGWRRFAVSGDVSRLDTAALPGGRDSVDVGVSYTGRRLSGRVAANAAKPTIDQPTLVAEAPSYSVDVGTSYSLTRNLDVTAGVRYRTESDRLRLQQLPDNRRDSQAVYVGTAFRF